MVSKKYSMCHLLYLLLILFFFSFCTFGSKKRTTKKKGNEEAEEGQIDRLLKSSGMQCIDRPVWICQLYICGYVYVNVAVCMTSDKNL